MTDKKLKVVFAPGAFDAFEGTQEELDALIKELEEGFADGSLFEKSLPVDLNDGSWSDEEIERLEKAFLEEGEAYKRTLN